MQTGYIHVPPPASAQMFGGIGNIFTAKNWRTFLPIYETQVGNGFDTLSCVTYSALNAIETKYKQKYGKELNFSDRFTSKMSGTTKLGNTFYAVADSISKHDGMVEESLWAKAGKTFEEYESPVPLSVQLKGKENLQVYLVSSSFVPLVTDTLCEAMEQNTLQVSGFAWKKPVNGLYQRTNEEGNHAFLLYGYEYGKKWMVYDQYDQAGNAFKELAWDYQFWGAMLYDITELTMTNVKILKDTNSKTVGFFIPAANEAVLDSLALSFGKQLAHKADGTIDFSKIIEGEYQLK